VAFLDKVSYIGGLIMGFGTLAYLLLLLVLSIRMACSAISRRITHGIRR
jgi:hypothetical protein